MQYKNIFAISGSLRAGSSNHNILKHIGGLLPLDVAYHIYDALSSIPPFDPGLDKDTPPEPVKALRNAITAADAIIICTPEYAFGVPGQLKNALDWLVSSSTLVDKPVVLITASLGGETAHAAMQLILGALSANIVDSLLIQFIRSKMDTDGNVKDEGTIESLKQIKYKLHSISN
ncbi:NADPH-dependent FMN reductase [Mucilaginibacter sp.]|uniref:NADPH-dependent FMN reductase n=1 Tax=Mucilaginibacter sp. TaxID=1882438 RepID=UPI00260D60B1|nr:NADPH-dependent FMN reductase [Mucilaginibacter sp.]MDB5126749.1 azr 2 [Mucilaginibacter sp.]